MTAYLCVGGGDVDALPVVHVYRPRVVVLQRRAHQQVGEAVLVEVVGSGQSVAKPGVLNPALCLEGAVRNKLLPLRERGGGGERGGEQGGKMEGENRGENSGERWRGGENRGERTGGREREQRGWKEDEYSGCDVSLVVLCCVLYWCVLCCAVVLVCAAGVWCVVVLCCGVVFGGVLVGWCVLVLCGLLWLWFGLEFVIGACCCIGMVC